MHCKIEGLRELAGCYLKGQILDDRQLAAKKHMAGCEECYQRFCMEYLLQETLLRASLLPDEVWEEEGLPTRLGQAAILQVRRLKGKLELAVQEGFQKDPIWDFTLVQGFAMARGTGAGSRYQSAVSEESSIQFRGGRVIVQLDQSQYPVESLAVRVSDGDLEEIFGFTFDEDTELHEVALDMGKYSEDARIEVIQKG